MSVFGWSLPAGCTRLPDDEDGSYSLIVEGKNYAWDDQDRVFVYSGVHESYDDDGYRFVGTCPWNDDEDPVTVLKRWLAERK